MSPLKASVSLAISQRQKSQFGVAFRYVAVKSKRFACHIPVSDSFLRKNGITDIHGFKAEHLNTTRNLKHFDIVRETSTKELLIIRQSTQQVVTHTGVFIP